MGDRANVAILDRKLSGRPEDAELEAVVLYTHWYGTELPDYVHAGLSRRERWEDAPYLARIIFCQMLKGEEGSLESTTGYGISTGLCDNEYPVLVLDCTTQRIASRKEEEYRKGPVREPEGLTFAEYCKLRPDGVQRFRMEGDRVKP